LKIRGKIKDEQKLKIKTQGESQINKKQKGNNNKNKDKILVKKMRHLVTEVNIPIPDGVTVTAKSRVVVVKGPLGTIQRAFKYASIDISKPADKNIKLTIW